MARFFQMPFKIPQPGEKRRSSHGAKLLFKEIHFLAEDFTLCMYDFWQEISNVTYP